MRKLAFSSLVVLLSAGPAPATKFMFWNDECDDISIVRYFSEHQDVAQFRQKLDDFRKKLKPLKDRDLTALFGKSQAKEAKTYAMPVAQFRAFSMSGSEHKAFSKSYISKDVAVLDVWYSGDGVTPITIIFYFPTDEDFPKLTKDNLAKRLAWDEDHFKKFLAYYEKRMAEVFPWEIDQK